MITFLLVVIIALLAMPAALGLLVLYHTLIREKSPTCDKTNRIAHLRLVWFAMTREEKFTPIFPWLKRDEWENSKR